MIERGKITAISKDGKTFTCGIPIFTKAGFDRFTVDAKLAYTPGCMSGYSVGDVVYIDFENMELEYPVIVGKQYRGQETQATNYSFNEKLIVKGTTKLSSDTTIDTLTYKDLKGACEKVKTLESQVAKLEADVEYLKNEVALILKLKS